MAEASSSAAVPTEIPFGGTPGAWDAWADSLPMASALGLSCRFSEPGRANFVLAKSPMALNPGGEVHGGVVAAAVDHCVGVVAVSVVLASHIVVTAALHIEYHRPSIAPLSFQAGVVRSGRSLVFVEVEFRGRDGRTCGAASAVMSPRLVPERGLVARDGPEPVQ